MDDFLLLHEVDASDTVWLIRISDIQYVYSLECGSFVKLANGMNLSVYETPLDIRARMKYGA